jgi:hypothetical protein
LRAHVNNEVHDRTHPRGTQKISMDNEPKLHRHHPVRAEEGRAGLDRDQRSNTARSLGVSFDHLVGARE